MTRFGMIAVWAVLAVSISTASAARRTGGDDRPPPTTAIAVGAPTSVPFGWADFCRRYAGECETGPKNRAALALTGDVWKTIEAVDRLVNAAVTPISDMDHWGIVDQWDYPTDGRGDCEDYALLKRKLLIQGGLPANDLLMTVVRDLQDQGHAVLMVKTQGGDYVLDNMNDAVKPWQATGYRFVKRQSQEDANVWVRLRGADVPVVGATR